MLTVEEIISLFEILVDDSTELSSAEELALLNRVYKKILNDKTWEILKKEYSSTTDGNNYLALPSDFLYFLENTGYTDNSFDSNDVSAPRAIYVAGSPLKLINWSDRRQYTDNSGYCYVDMPNSRLYFCNTPDTGKTVSGDYYSKPVDLVAGESPLFTNHNEIIAYGMAVEDMAIQLFEKARSYADQYNARYNSYLTDMSYDNQQLLNY